MKKLIASWLLFVAVFPAAAVIISGGDGSGNTTAPTDDPGFNKVGRIRASNGADSSVTYLGDKWFITAHHVKYFDSPTGVVVNGSSYAIDASSWERITNSTGAYAGQDADLTVFQITKQPDILPLRIRSDRIPFSADVVMIGNGRNRSANLTYWTTNWVATNAVSGVYSGYVWATGSSLRWGENQVSSRDPFDDGSFNGEEFGKQYGFQTTFDADGGSNECQAIRYDSGGGVFYKNGSEWELAGIMLSTSGYPDQGVTRAVYGNSTYIADISYYRSQITNYIENFDSDVDGLPDWWESEHTNSATAMVASVDTDGDGFTNLEEWYSDTNPTNSISFFDNSSLLTLSNQTFSFDGSTARQYQVFYTTNSLSDTNLSWVAHHSPILGTGSNSTITVTNTEDTVFYRLRVTLP
jgi:hypothetical protein